MVPIVDGAVLHFGARGIYNGLSLLGDDETGSYWDHITGECVHGPLKGKEMQLFPVEHMTVAQALKRWPELKIALSRPHLTMRLLRPFINWMGKRGIFPPGFRGTMGERDPRLPEMTSGLGIFTDRTRRFYPVDAIRKNGGEIRDVVDGRPISVAILEGGFPQAKYLDGPDSPGSSEKPMQLYTRWYGFSLTFPNCDLYRAER